MGERGDATWVGITTTLRVDKPDGSEVEFVWCDSGRVSARSSGPSGVDTERIVVDFAASGAAVLSRLASDGTVAGPVEPATSDERINAFGTTIMRADHGPVGTVEHHLDHDGRLTETVVGGPWGEEHLQVRPDGGRTLRWRTALHHGSQDWDEAGRRRRFEAEFSDGTRYRWTLVDGVAHGTVTDAHGVEHALDVGWAPRLGS